MSLIVVFLASFEIKEKERKFSGELLLPVRNATES